MSTKAAFQKLVENVGVENNCPVCDALWANCQGACVAHAREATGKPGPYHDAYNDDCQECKDERRKREQEARWRLDVSFKSDKSAETHYLADDDALRTWIRRRFELTGDFCRSLLSDGVHEIAGVTFQLYANLPTMWGFRPMFSEPVSPLYKFSCGCIGIPLESESRNHRTCADVIMVYSCQQDDISDSVGFCVSVVDKEKLSGADRLPWPEALKLIRKVGIRLSQGVALTKIGGMLTMGTHLNASYLQLDAPEPPPKPV